MYKLVKKEMVDTITVPILSLCKGILLVHKVRLSKPDASNNRDYYHKEFIYNSKYNDVKQVSTLRLSHSSILAIEDKGGDSYESLIININNRDFIVKSLSKCKTFLKQDDMFVDSETAGMIINPKYKSTSAISFEPYRGKVVVVKPCVINYDEQDSIAGIALCMNAKTMSYIHIPADTFKTMVKVVRKFDFHVSGLLALTYLQSAEIGVHEFSYTRTNIRDFDVAIDAINTLIKRSDSDDSLSGIVSNKNDTKQILNNKGW